MFISIPQELASHSQGLPTIVTEDVDNSNSGSQHRQRSGTWGQSRSGRTTPPIIKSNFKDKRKCGEDSGSNSESQSPKKGSASVFDAIRPRSKSDASSKPAKKGGNIITHVKNAVQNSLMSSGSKTNHSSGASIVSDSKDNLSSGKQKHEENHVWNGTVSRPRADSDSSNNNKGAVTKVIELFRHRSQSAVSAEDKRKARAAAIHQQQIAAQSALLRRSSLDPDRRRLSLGTVNSSYRGSSDLLDLHHAVNAAVLFRDSRGLPVATSFLDKIDFADLEKDGGNQIFVKFFKFHKCYDLIPTSAKLVVFDTQLLVKKAFFALVYNGIRAAPLWDSVHQQYVGMLTITDFIKILQMYYTSSSITMEELEEHKLETWREVLKEEVKPLVSIGPDKSLFDAIRNLIDYKIHRLPVIDEMGNVLYILTHKRILRFLFLYINDLPKPSFLNKTLRDLKIGTYENVETVAEETSIIHALRKFLERRVSALPMTDSEGHLVDIFAKFDVINLAAEKTYTNLDVTLKEANEHKTDWFEGVEKCLLDETLFTVMERIVRAEVHRLVVVDEDDHVLGVLSLSDILVYLVLKPSDDDIGVDETSSDSEVPVDPDLASSDDKVFEENEEPRDYVQNSCWGEVPVSV
ncbi:5'-AMP-activated protein kinase subunit gamma-2 isoform X3 [Diaphorina citri]|uniref:5'-AMP-activated protein kinase subunit gamma-2 isoform X1 n=2 Tax=Diaphorina citri TaxID=121845 RepID=A0A1S4EDV4_DIACI|nr:5'-AMP-activated protein kinase subunit gamma-2 isoform X2 [Diaphorina citri]XP_026680620.1 5'-AMP-activated protein kinase subunit gamma-2 isoform X1 [Diaphorina citri]XP_026680621.1 5'-AMP-activated protein kinase subunit gamma-2 isoform X3 [Diaphorina citri]